MLKLPDEVLLEWSFAVQDTVVVPRGNVSPDVWSHETVGDGSMASVAVALKLTLAPEELVASAVMFAGSDRMGAVESTTVTVTVKLAVPMFVPSLAEQLTVVVPGLNFDPEVGAQLTWGEPATASVALAEPYVTATPVGSPVVTLSLPGGVTTGGVVSTTWTVKEVGAGSLQLTGVSPRANTAPDGGVQANPPLS